MVSQVAHRLPQILLRPSTKDLRAGALHFRSLGAEHDAATPDTVFGAAQGESDFYGLSVKANRRQVVHDRIGRRSWVVSGRLGRHADPGAGLKQHYKWLGVTQCPPFSRELQLAAQHFEVEAFLADPQVIVEEGEDARKHWIAEHRDTGCEHCQDRLQSA